MLIFIQKLIKICARMEVEYFITGSQRLGQHPGSLFGFNLGPQHIFYGCVACVLVFLFES